MRNPKIVDGKIEYRYKTFDGSFVSCTVPVANVEPLLKTAEENSEVPGYELVNGNYYFATEQVVMKFKKSKGES